MISSIEPWRTKEQLQEVLRRRPSAVWITGVTLENKRFDGYVNSVPYRTTVVVKYKGKHWYFRKNTDGTYEVI